MSKKSWPISFIISLDFISTIQVFLRKLKITNIIVARITTIFDSFVAYFKSETLQSTLNQNSDQSHRLGSVTVPSVDDCFKTNKETSSEESGMNETRHPQNPLKQHRKITPQMT